jgi:hypothetical protein
MKIPWKGLASISKMMLLPQKGKEGLNLSLLSSPLQRQTPEINGQFPILHQRNRVQTDLSISQQENIMEITLHTKQPQKAMKTCI